MAFTGSLEDRTLIRELHDTYADAGFRSDKQQWLDCWTDDCTWQVPQGGVSGKPALSGMWDGLWQTFDKLGFFTVLGAIEVDGDRAMTRAYVREIFVPLAGGMQKIVGRYDDELVRIDGRWLFSSRVYSVLIREECA